MRLPGDQVAGNQDSRISGRVGGWITGEDASVEVKVKKAPDPFFQVMVGFRCIG